MENVKLALDAISLYQTQYAQVDKVWGYFSVVTLAMIGFIIGSNRATRTLLEPLVIVTAFLVFCIGNHQALVAGQIQLEQLATIAIALAEKANINIDSFQPLSHESVSHFHLGIIAAVCIGVVVVAWLRKQSHDRSGQQDANGTSTSA